MKHVFLLGDSIRLGYDQYVQQQLEGKAQVYWVEDNGRFVQYTLRYLHEWARQDCDPEIVDLICWNNGLWDALHLLGDEAQTPLDEYENGLRRIIRRLRKVFPNAQILFALTTAVVEEYLSPPGLRRNDEIRQYNESAGRIMEEEGIDTVDLYSVSLAMPLSCRTPEGTHFTDEGYRLLGKSVAEAIR